MMFTIKVRVLLVAVYCSAYSATLLQCLSPEVRAKGFVYLHEVDPTIQTSVRYATHENFVGKPVDGYKKPVVIVTERTAHALKAVQEEVKKEGFCLVVYDGYRPQHAQDHFIHWSTDIKDQQRKKSYYPRVNKADVLTLGYVGKRSWHSRGNRVDLTLIENGKQVHAIEETTRMLNNGHEVPFLDDGTVDMGSSFDLFDIASHYKNDVIPATYQKLRTYLKEVMERHGFKNYAQEWWHFTLKDEPCPAQEDASYFNFPVE